MIKKKKLKNKKRMNGMVADNLQLFFLQLPSLILFFIFCYFPMYGIIIAFKRFNPNKGIWKSPWNGFDNFEFFFTSQDAVTVIRNTVAYNFSWIFIGLFCSVAVALMLYNLRKRWLVKTYNTIMILPKFLSAVLVAYIVYALLNPVSGVMNTFIEFCGGEGVDWYAKPGAWPFILTIVNQWQIVGMDSIIYYAALMGINPELFEAATIDGAGKWKQTLNIAIPELVSIMTVKSILAFGSIFSGDFGLFYQVPRNTGTLYPTTDIINTYIFRALTDGNMGVSAAIGFVQSVVGLFMIVFVNLIVRKVSPDNSLF